jgi:hypothetical protein
MLSQMDSSSRYKAQKMALKEAENLLKQASKIRKAG